mmetsp:Transcript_99/g.121  ORF Transcript_99/g.121 Transcript_99/m.121 type:complete len:140 (+) Transcript_99:613-1032(+)
MAASAISENWDLEFKSSRHESPSFRHPSRLRFPKSLHSVRRHVFTTGRANRVQTVSSSPLEKLRERPVRKNTDINNDCKTPDIDASNTKGAAYALSNTNPNPTVQKTTRQRSRTICRIGKTCTTLLVIWQAMSALATGR